MPTESEPRIKMWLPGYHTPSLNKTKGHHWRQYHLLKKQAAAALLSALSGSQHNLSTQTITQAQLKLHSIAYDTPSRRSSSTTVLKTLISNSAKRGAGTKTRKAPGSSSSPRR